MLKELREDQRGLSLIELIVVIAIMGVVTAGSLIGFSLVSGRNIKSCYSQMGSYIQETKNLCMSREDCKLQIYMNDKGEVMVKQYRSAAPATEPVSVRIGKKGLTVTYKSGGATVTVSDTSILELSFDRSSGAFKPLPGGGYCDEIIITDEAGREIKVALVQKTGKFYLE